MNNQRRKYLLLLTNLDGAYARNVFVAPNRVGEAVPRTRSIKNRTNDFYVPRPKE